MRCAGIPAPAAAAGRARAPRWPSAACSSSLVDRAGEHRVVGGARRGEAQRRVGGRHRRLGIVEQLLVQLLAGPQADELDLDVAVGHAGRRGGSSAAPDRRSSPARPCRARRSCRATPRHRPAPPSPRLRSTSSTASRTVMKKRVTSGWVTVSGPPAASWRGEQRHHRAGRAQHIAEPHRDEAGAGAAAAAALRLLQVERLADRSRRCAWSRP